jgi:hypothetical protein
MNGAGASDLLLALVCAGVIATQRRARPGVALAAGLIGLAAVLGVMRFSGLAMMTGPNKFASLLSAAAAFPLLAWCLRYPASRVALHFGTAVRPVLILVALGVAVTMAGVAQWGAALSLLSALVLLGTLALRRNALATVGAVVLLGGMLATLAGRAGAAAIDPAVALHLGLAVGLALLVAGTARRTAVT